MDFYLSEELQMMQNTVRRLAKEKIAPRAAEVDETATYPEDFYQAYKETGLLGLDYPEEYGGSGMGTLALCLAIEEVAKYCCSAGLILLLTKLPGMPILLAGTEAQKQKYLRGICEGTLKASFCLTEPGAGSDASNIQTTARRKGDYYYLNGSKCFISGSTVADFYTIVAKTDPTAGSKGVSIFVVERGTPGLSLGKVEKKMGVKGVPMAEVVMDDCEVPAVNMLGEENKGFRTVMKTLNSVRPVVGARGLGLAEGALAYAVEYTKTRLAFGHPIAEFQGLRWMIAEMAMKIEASRLLVYRAASLVDEGKIDKETAHLL
ncbi:MAG: acyl-CoA dehydrogenase family protein, partial [Bacillota bacterium]